LIDILQEASHVASEHDKQYTRDDIILMQNDIIQFMTTLVMEQRIAMNGMPSGNLDELYSRLPNVLDAVRYIGQLRDMLSSKGTKADKRLTENRPAKPTKKGGK
jgi:hypothetical protein